MYNIMVFTLFYRLREEFVYKKIVLRSIKTIRIFHDNLNFSQFKQELNFCHLNVGADENFDIFFLL